MARRRPVVSLERQTVLFHYLLWELGFDRWEQLPIAELQRLEGEPVEALATPFASALWDAAHRKPRGLQLLDARVVAATTRINARRGSMPVRWKYFQYLALLLTELYLERYFADPHSLRAELEVFAAAHAPSGGRSWPDGGAAPGTGGDDLAKLGFWLATGSGKTLLVHAHYHQYLAALERSGRPRPDHVLLITPNGGLARQHLREMFLSDVPGRLFRKGAIRGRRGRTPWVHVIEITRFRDRPGPLTVSPDAFAGRNLVLVDEGHRGSSRADGEWRRFRQQLACGGFCFEYSATFAEAAATSPALFEECTRTIAIDYSFARFYQDGYGKHWRILNLDEGGGAALGLGGETRAYLTGAMAVFLQQLLVYEEAPPLAHLHLLARPLAVFVGASVTGGRESRQEQTDIVRVIELFARLVDPAERCHNERLLALALAGTLGVRTNAGEEVFDPQTVLGELVGRWTGAGLYEQMLRLVFHAAAPGRLHLFPLGEAPGEVAIAVGDSPPFALLNVGDVHGVLRLCATGLGGQRVVVQERRFCGSLFDRIDEPASSIQILVGSRKFAEGWSSFRVSILGLLHLGRAAGTQVVQLFGRGVRLLGKDRSLRRSSSSYEIHQPRTAASRLRVLETLHVFGLRASYLARFRAALLEAGVPWCDERCVPVAKEMPPAVLPLPPRQRAERHGRRPVLRIEADVPRVEFDATSRVELTSSSPLTSIPRSARTTRGPLLAFAFVDHDELYASLVRWRDERGLFRLALPRKVPGEEGTRQPLTRSLLDQGGWYELTAPEWLFEPLRLRHLPIWQRVATQLVTVYAQEFAAVHGLRPR